MNTKCDICGFTLVGLELNSKLCINCQKQQECGKHEYVIRIEESMRGDLFECKKCKYKRYVAYPPPKKPITFTDEDIDRREYKRLNPEPPVKYVSQQNFDNTIQELKEMIKKLEPKKERIRTKSEEEADNLEACYYNNR